MNSIERVTKQEWKIVAFIDGYDSGNHNTGMVTHEVRLEMGQVLWTAYVSVHHWSSTRTYGPDFADIKNIRFEPRVPWGCKDGLTKLVLDHVMSWMEEEDGALCIQSDIK